MHWLAEASPNSLQRITDYGLHFGPSRGRPGGANQGSMGNISTTSIVSIRTINGNDCTTTNRLLLLTAVNIG